MTIVVGLVRFHLDSVGLSGFVVEWAAIVKVMIRFGGDP